MTNDLKGLLNSLKSKQLKAIEHLEFSLKIVEKLTSNVELLSLSELEHWESFSARFARAVDFFLSKYLRTLVLFEDPGFRGSFRDLVYQGEKLEIIENAQIWIKIREFRNISAHEYEEENLAEHFEQMKKFTPFIIQLGIKLKNAPIKS